MQIGIMQANRNYANPWAAASRNGPQVDYEFPRTGTPRPRDQQEHPIRYADEVCATWSCSRGLRWPGWESQTQNFWNLCSQIKTAAPRSPKLGCPDKKFCLASLPSFGADGRLAGSGQQLPAKLVANISTASHALMRHCRAA
eukprot:671430-Pelagomonas_calceolata.AAC.1